MHRWGDERVDWNRIYGAAQYIAKYCAKWGRISILDYKEKYGTSRVYVFFGIWSMLNLVTPFAHYHHGWPKWLMRFDIWAMSRILPKLDFLVIPYQQKIYTMAYGRALKKYPHLSKEIISGADHPNLLKQYMKEYVSDDI